jgi:hypothetical protein
MPLQPAKAHAAPSGIFDHQNKIKKDLLANAIDGLTARPEILNKHHDRFTLPHYVNKFVLIKGVVLGRNDGVQWNRDGNSLPVTVY